MAKIYLASSWRNELQPVAVKQLRDAGHEVYDFRNPPNRSGFAWEQVGLGSPDNCRMVPYLQALEHPTAQAGFHSDFNAMEWCDTCVMLLPCGNSAHLELGWCAGNGKITFIVNSAPTIKADLMYLCADHIVRSIHEVNKFLI